MTFDDLQRRAFDEITSSSYPEIISALKEQAVAETVVAETKKVEPAKPSPPKKAEKEPEAEVPAVVAQMDNDACADFLGGFASDSDDGDSKP